MKILLLCILALGLGGCATITNDAGQNVRIETVTPDGRPVVSADCTLSNDFSTTYGKSGTSVQVHRSSENLAISCASAGNLDAKGTAISRANAGLAGNIIFGGAIGAVIDHNKGTAYSYPVWIKLVFGQERVYDRRNEVDGVSLLGTLPNGGVAIEPGASGIAPVPGVSPLPSGNAPAPPGFIASGFARIDDVDAVPYISDRARDEYRKWMALPTPKAFAISSTGRFAATQGLRPRDRDMPTDPLERALLMCERSAKRPCNLYAVNGSVVWTKTVAPANAVAMEVPK